MVRLQRLPAGWWVLGVNGRSIQITSPTRLQRISSPLTVRGTAPDVYEGTLYFKVTQDRPGRDLLLGQGFVDGSASTQPGDLGTLRFRQPASTAPGWVTFYDASADGSNGIIQATMVRVQFAAATQAPRILEVTTSPRLRTLDGGFWLELPQGEGKVVFSVKATDAQRVRFTLTPTGTEVADLHQAAGRGPHPGRRVHPCLALPGRGPLRPPGHPGHRPWRHRQQELRHRPLTPQLATGATTQPVAPVAL